MQIESSPILLALGANLASRHGGPAETLRAAWAAIEAAGIRVAARSRLYASPADPPSAQPDYVNAAVVVETGLAPAALLAALHAIEAAHGRARTVRNAARPLDIDIVDYRGRVEGGPAPILPHPRAHRRAFVLRPIADIVPDWRHPISRRTVSELIAGLPADAVPAEPLV